MKSDETPTKPENADPVMAAIGRLEGKVDRLTGMLSTFFEELSAQKLKTLELDERVSFMEHPANGR
jgi:hypothetical protein